MKKCIYSILLLFFSSYLFIQNAVANPKLAIEELGCEIRSATSSGEVNVSCSEKVLESEASTVGGLKKCDPVTGKPETVTLRRLKGESNASLLNRLYKLWDQKVAQQCKGHTDQKCSFFPGDENKDNASCVFDRYDAVEVTENTGSKEGTLTATPQCNYVCKACSVGAQVSVSRR